MNKYALMMLAMTCGLSASEVMSVAEVDIVSTDDATKLPPVVSWSGSNVVDISDVDLRIKSNVTLPLEQTFIFAENSDVTVRVDKDVTIKANNDGQSILVLAANVGRTITFELTHDLTFIGTKNDPMQPLLIGIIGGGTVIFRMHNGDSLKFDSESDRGGAEMYCVFQESQIPTCIFEFHGGKQLKFNRRCKLGHYCVAPVLIEDFVQGGFQFDVSNAPGQTIQLECKEGFAIPFNTIPAMPMP